MAEQAARHKPHRCRVGHYTTPGPLRPPGHPVQVPRGPKGKGGGRQMTGSHVRGRLIMACGHHHSSAPLSSLCCLPAFSGSSKPLRPGFRDPCSRAGFISFLCFPPPQPAASSPPLRHLPLPLHMQRLHWLNDGRPCKRSCRAHARHALMHACALGWVEPGQYSLEAAPRSPDLGCDARLLSTFFADDQQLARPQLLGAGALQQQDLAPSVTNE